MDPQADAAGGRAARRTGILNRACPQCGQVALRRVERQHRDAESARSRQRAYARFTPMRCTAPGCGFAGQVPRRARRRGALRWTQRRWRQTLARLRSWSRLLGALGLAGLTAGVSAAVGAAWERSHAPTPAQLRDQLRDQLPPGEYHDGDPLPPAHPLAHPLAAVAPGSQGLAVLDLRGACVWGRPGRNPYRGSVAEALSAAQLPASVRAALVAKVAAGARDARLVIGNDGIHDPASGRVFAARGFAMTYGRTLCLETRVNFAAGHTEAADLFEANDEGGRRYSVMVPDVCGNVSVIGGGMPPQLRLSTLRADDPGPPGHTVPLPGTLSLVLAGLAATAGVAWRRPR